MTRTRNAPFNRIVQALVHIQANLNQDLALGLIIGASRPANPLRTAADVAPTPELSPTRIVRLAPMTVGFIRHLGPTERVSPDHFTRLLA